MRVGSVRNAIPNGNWQLVAKPYVINCNIDVKDGLINCAVGILKAIKYKPTDCNDIIRIFYCFK